MNILKIYRDRETAVCEMKAFTKVNPGAKCSIKDFRATLYNGTKVHFGYAKSEEDLVKYQGWVYQALEVHTHLSEESVSWLMSRIRG